MRAIYRYRFVSVEDIPNTNESLLTAMYMREPAPIEYVKSFFGIFAPWPKMKEYEVKFITDCGIWVELSTLAPCSNDLRYILNEFYRKSGSCIYYDLVGVV